MLREQTVYVLGAGASKEAGLPTGGDLTKAIANLVVLRPDDFGNINGNDPKFVRALGEMAQRRFMEQGKDGRADLSEYARACSLIASAMPQSLSIDNFIHIHRDNPAIEVSGKLAIARFILTAEQRSLLYVDPSNIYNTINFERLEKTWFNGFIKLLTEYNSLDDLMQRLPSLSFIVFNYDRCLEHFLFYSFKNVYGIDNERAADLVSKVSIFHPYGVLGPLPWQARDGAIPFGSEPGTDDLCNASNRLKTFTESRGKGGPEISRIQTAIIEARTVVFLGFAYHPLNLELLFPRIEYQTKLGRAVGTALNLSKEDAALVKVDLLRAFRQTHGNAVIVDEEATCALLLSKHWRSLSQS